MKHDEYLNHLDRAFTKAPPELTTSVEEAFRRGEEAMKQRHKIMTALSVAAAVAVLCAALALAAGRLATPRPDTTVAAKGGATAEPIQESLRNRPTPMSRSTPEPTYPLIPTPIKPDMPELVYTQPNSQYFHSTPDCSGMEGAVAWTLESAISVGKQPCPVCMTDDDTEVRDAQSEEWTETTGQTTPVPEEHGIEGNEIYNDSRAAVYYATMEGRYYHEDSNCSGMKGALPWTFGALWYKNEKALQTGDDGYAVKQPCPVCVDSWNLPVVGVYATTKGKYYHIEKNCSGMKNAAAWCSAEVAEEAGKTPCPVCLPDGDNLCWATSGGQYYHIQRECMGMKGARICMETSAQRQGKEPCPVCWK